MMCYRAMFLLLFVCMAWSRERARRSVCAWSNLKIRAQMTWRLTKSPLMCFVEWWCLFHFIFCFPTVEANVGRPVSQFFSSYNVFPVFGLVSSKWDADAMHSRRSIDSMRKSNKRISDCTSTDTTIPKITIITKTLVESCALLLLQKYISTPRKSRKISSRSCFDT